MSFPGRFAVPLSEVVERELGGRAPHVGDEARDGLPLGREALDEAVAQVLRAARHGEAEVREDELDHAVLVKGDGAEVWEDAQVAEIGVEGLPVAQEADGVDAGGKTAASAPERPHQAPWLVVLFEDEDAQALPGQCDGGGHPPDARADNHYIVAHAASFRNTIATLEPVQMPAGWADRLSPWAMKAWR